jgi:hypothetical protein
MTLPGLLERIDPREIISEGQQTFNVPLTAGTYAPEILTLRMPPGYAWIRARFNRETAVPAGTVCEEWGLKNGGDYLNDADYLPTFSLMTSNAVSVAFGPRTGVQVRLKSGGTAGAVTVHGLCTQIEPVLEAKIVTFNVPVTSGQYAPERMMFRSPSNILIGHIAVILEAAAPTGTVFDTWVLKTGGNPLNDADFFPSGVTFLAGSALGGNPSVLFRTVQLRAKSGGTAGAVTMHGLCTAKTGRV